MSAAKVTIKQEDDISVSRDGGAVRMPFKTLFAIVAGAVGGTASLTATYFSITGQLHENTASLAEMRRSIKEVSAKVDTANEEIQKVERRLNMSGVVAPKTGPAVADSDADLSSRG